MSDPKSVDAADPAKKTSKVTGPVSDEATILTNVSMKCYWNDEEFESGDRVANDGKCYECSNGMWVEV
jgi:hypothetical protein